MENIKIKKYILYTVMVILILAMISLYRTISRLEPIEHIVGTYQSTEYLPDLYTFSFMADRTGDNYMIETKGDFYSEINGQVKYGRFEHYRDNIYICHTENESILITMLNEGFYFYHADTDRIIEIKKVLDVPSYIKN